MIERRPLRGLDGVDQQELDTVRRRAPVRETGHRAATWAIRCRRRQAATRRAPGTSRRARSPRRWGRAGAFAARSWAATAAPRRREPPAASTRVKQGNAVDTRQHLQLLLLDVPGGTGLDYDSLTRVRRRLCGLPEEDPMKPVLAFALACFVAACARAGLCPGGAQA
ncbi:MAG: hypothetical protein MZV63_23760 [Marinilabiliales bacterium]|nr:hypothetical protein [Marinilabiliales bacterium]